MMAPIVRDIDFVLARAADQAGFERWAQHARSTGWCEHPIRLVGTTRQVNPETGEVLSLFTTDDEPNGQLLKACGTRRATMCGPCSQVYRSDAWHLIASGLRGGKGVPCDVTDHPMLFLTLTAPSFGTVHSERSEGGSPRPCRPGKARRCIHGRSSACVLIHVAADEVVGDPLCAECFDYPGAVLWNAHATELWRRTLIGVQRRVASHLGVSASMLKDHARVSYAKVVEYQRRGLVHLHVVVRLDGPAGPSGCPPADIDAEMLQDAVVAAAQQVTCPYTPTPGVTGAARWGEQIDVRRIEFGSAPPEAVAAYISKYATKSTDPLGRLDRRLDESDLAHLTVRPHLGELVGTAWRLGGRPELEHLGLRRWAHTLGFRGHWLTKSRRYSTTLGALRSARSAWKAAGTDAGNELDELAVVKDWRYTGRGWNNPGDAWLARTAAEAATEARQLAREVQRRPDDLQG